MLETGRHKILAAAAQTAAECQGPVVFGPLGGEFAGYPLFTISESGLETVGRGSLADFGLPNWILEKHFMAQPMNLRFSIPTNSNNFVWRSVDNDCRIL